MTTLYCTAQDAVEQVGDLELDGSDDTVTGNVTDIVGAVAAEIYDVLSKQGLKSVPDSCQANILALINAQLAGVQLIEQRGSVIDPRIEKIAQIENTFAQFAFSRLKAQRLFPAWYNGKGQPANLPTIRPSYRTIAFSSAGGANSLSSAGAYTGKNTTVFTVQIDTLTTFKCKQDGGSFSSSVTITGNPQTLANGVTITLPTSGHSIGDQWTITITVMASTTTVRRQCPGLDFTQLSTVPTQSVTDKWLDWVVCLIYAIAAKFNYQLVGLNENQARIYGRIATQFVAAMALQAMAFRNRSPQIALAAFKKMQEAIDELNELSMGRYRITLQRTN